MASRQTNKINPSRQSAEEWCRKLNMQSPESRSTQDLLWKYVDDALIEYVH